MNHREVAHRWAQRRGDSGKGHSLFYKGDSIYSYGYHFKVAQWVQSPKGEWFVLFNSGTYSSSTSRHQCYVRQAIPAGTRVIASDMSKHMPDVLRNLEETAEELYGKYKRARVHKDFYMARLGDVLDDIRWLCEQYDLESTYKDGIDNEKLEEARKAEYERKKAEQLRIAAENDERIRRWLRGDSVQYPHGLSKIRLRILGDNIETSWGANVPLDVAPHLWKLVQHCRRDNAGYTPCNIDVDVGYYKLNHVYANGDIKVGCHTIEYDELERIAKQLGYIQETEHAQ